MSNCLLRQKSPLFKGARWVGIGLIFGLLGACSKATIPISYVSTPTNVDFKINSVQVRSFSSNQRGYGDKMAELVKNDITREGFIKVVDRGGQTKLTGTISIGRIDKKAHYKKHEWEDKDGKKHVSYTYYFRKQFTTQATYSLKKGNKQIAGGNLTEDYDKEWSGENASEAKANSASDDQIIISSLNVLARQIVSAVSPHKAIRSFPIPCSSLVDKLRCWNRPETTKLGAKYYEKGRYDQAEKYWQQTIENEQKPEYQAEAHYLIGVLRVKDELYPKAFRRFQQADELDPGNDFYMNALSQAEKAKWNKLVMAQTFGGPQGPSIPVGGSGPSRSGNLAYRLTVSAIPSDSRIRILNIKPKYRAGIKLKPGKYKIEVSKRGYKTKIEWVSITDDNLVVDIELSR
jgi:tetratricopeptide (TPR) repeat protein